MTLNTHLYLKTPGRRKLCTRCNRYFNERAASCYHCRTEKICKKCNVLKPLEAYYKSKTSGDGHKYTCQECDDAYSRQRRISIRNKTLDFRVKTKGRTKFCIKCDQYYNSRAPDCPYCRTEKICNTCNILKSLDEFYPKADQVDGHYGDCRQCYRDIIHYSKTYGITKDELLELRSLDSGLCAICKTRPQQHLDHDHQSNRIRAFLCNGCNMGIGFLGENPDTLRAAANYLERYK